jgi:hypothetical protein
MKFATFLSARQKNRMQKACQSIRSLFVLLLDPMAVKEGVIVSQPPIIWQLHHKSL